MYTSEEVMTLVTKNTSKPQFVIKDSENYCNSSKGNNTCLISKALFILKQKTNILPNVSQLMLDFISYCENA